MDVLPAYSWIHDCRSINEGKKGQAQGKLAGNFNTTNKAISPEIGQFIQEKNGSKDLTNMFVKLIDYFSKYQNTYVKHNDSVIESEIEFIYEMTSSFMKLLIRMK